MSTIEWFLRFGVIGGIAIFLTVSVVRLNNGLLHRLDKVTEQMAKIELAIRDLIARL